MLKAMLSFCFLLEMAKSQRLKICSQKFVHRFPGKSSIIDLDLFSNCARALVSKNEKFVIYLLLSI